KRTGDSASAGTIEPRPRLPSREHHREKRTRPPPRGVFRMRRSWWISTAFVAFLTLGAFSARPQSEPSSSFVGAEKCKDCHESEYKAFAAGAHGQAVGDRAVLGQSTTCHTSHLPH